MKYSPDRYKFKPAFSISSMDVGHGWFDTKRLHFHIDKNLLTMNED